MAGKTAGQIEASISEAMVRFEREFMGRGPTRTRSYLLDDVVLVRLEGVLTPAEQQLAKDERGVRLLKEVRTNLIEQANDMLMGIIQEHTGREVQSMHSDVSARTGERVIVFVLHPRR